MKAQGAANVLEFVHIQVSVGKQELRIVLRRDIAGDNFIDHQVEKGDIKVVVVREGHNVAGLVDEELSGLQAKLHIAKSRPLLEWNLHVLCGEHGRSEVHVPTLIDAVPKLS